MLVPIGTHYDLRKDTSKAIVEEPSVEYAVGTWINLWALKRERFVKKFAVLNITNNVLANSTNFAT